MTPRNQEILERILLGQKQVQISKEMGISAVRVSMITRSPLFRLELKRQLIKKFERLAAIQDKLLEASERGANLFNDILDTKAPYATETKIKAATAAQLMMMRLLQLEKNLNTGTESTKQLDDNNGTYEEHLRKVTFEESIKRPISEVQDESQAAENEAIENLLLDNNQIESGFQQEEAIFEKGEEIIN